jgi:hypothetical protein
MGDITLSPVKQSSSIRSVGWERDTQTLRVEFTSNAQYDYHGVPFEKYDALRSSEHPGTYFAESIRGNYDFVCIRKRVKDATKTTSKKESKIRKATDYKNGAT